MRALRYKVKISIDAVHSWGDEVISEIWIPDLKIAVNEKGFAFHCDELRSDQEPMIEIEMNEKDCETLKAHIKSLSNLEKLTQKLFQKE